MPDLTVRVSTDLNCAAARESWLLNEPWTPADVVARSVAADDLEYYPVTRAMNSAKHVTPDCIEPITIPQQEFGFV